MRKISLISFLIFHGCYLFGQLNSNLSINKENSLSHFYEKNINLLNNWAIDQKIDFNSKLNFPLLSHHSTPNAFYFRYQIAFDSIPIYGKQFLIQYNQSQELTRFVSPQLKIYKPNIYENNPDYLYCTKSELIPIYLNLKKSNTQMLFYENTQRNFQLKESTISGIKDSLITVQVFYPDPITSSKQTYGAPYADQNNGINTNLLSEHFIKQMKASFSNDTFKLESNYFLLNEHSKPIDTIWYSLTDSAIYDRSNSNFEAINISFHINQFRDYLDSLDFQQLGNRQILIDPHGFEGADLSSFNNLKQPVELTFGTGGVDDGEDAGIIIHEYTHSLTDHASPKSNIGSQRIALEEGICDYVAASYMRDISEYRWQDLYKWDGHNEFWPGRTIDFSAMYPNDTAGNIYESGGVISATLMELWPIMGKQKLDSLVFESMYSLMPNMSLLDFAELLIKTEDLLFKGYYKNEICGALNNHGLGKPCFKTSLSKKNNSACVILNSDNFAKGNSDLIILIPVENTEYRIINLAGETVLVGQTKADIIRISPLSLKKGFYVVQLNNQTQSNSIKIQRY